MASTALTCEQCGDTFDVLPSRAERRTYCSRECSVAAQRERVELACAGCGDGFEVPPSVAEEGRRYCSMACRRNRVRRECEHCGEAFERPASQAEGARFCSATCRAEAERDRVEIECEHCGEAFTVPRSKDGQTFCSRECYVLDRDGVPEELLAAVDGAETVRDVAQELRIPYEEARRRLGQAGLLDGLLTAEEIIERATAAEAD